MTNERLRHRADSPAPKYSSPVGGDKLLFLSETLRTFHDTGALAPSGPELVNAMVVPVTSRPNRPISVLEVGAGTGVVTRRLVQALRPGDRLHVVEPNPRFADRLREDPVLAARHPGVTLRLSACRVEELPHRRPPAPGGALTGAREEREEREEHPDHDEHGERYDAIVSGLPFTNFRPAQVREILDLYLRLLAPGGELTYFGYLGTAAARTLTSGPRRGARHRAVVRLLRQFEATYGLGERTVWRNLPPARAYLLRSPGGREEWTPPTGAPAGSTGAGTTAPGDATARNPAPGDTAPGDTAPEPADGTAPAPR
ncbi:class I SAM-dependent methyltransferase [Kitasatospora sp. NPDC056446]|uniref:class I SAM-dependent methyltransferase n=1 Tax=Kitasatospora sp. NPDC056446 TaxID=3345819 RepID=UPI0036D175A5